MDRRKDHLSKWVAHLPDLPYRRSENAGIPVGARRNETNGLYRTENSSESRMDSANVPLKVANLIYESEFWGSTNFKWLFSELVPEWFETDPEDWPVVRRILQEFIHRDFVRQYSRVKEHVEPRQAELNVSDSESSESHGSPVVRIVCPKENEQSLKSCLKVKSHRIFGAYQLKLVIIGSIDVELFPLDEDEIEWKQIHFNLDRFCVNNRYIRDFSLREMQVRKLCELGLDLCTSNDENDDLVAAKSRSHLCALYNQKLQSQIAEHPSHKTADVLKAKHMVCKRHVKGSDPTMEELKLHKVKGGIISPDKSAKRLLTSKMRDSTRPSQNSSPATNNEPGYKELTLSNHVKEVICGRRINSESMVASNAKSTRGGRINTARCYAEYVSHVPIGGLLDSSSKSYNTTGRMQNKKRVEHGVDRARRSISLQSLDDLLDEVLEDEEAMERRRRKKTSTKSEPDNTLGKSWVSAEVPDKVVVQKDQPTSKDSSLNETASEKEEFGGWTRNITSPLNDDILQILDELDADSKPKHKNKKNTGKPQIELTKDDRNEQLLKEHCRIDMNRLEHSKRPKFRRDCAEPRSPLEIYYKRPSPGSMHRNDPEKLGAIANLSSASIGSEETFESYVSTANYAASHLSPVRQNDSNATYKIEVDANCESSNTNINICDTGHSQSCEHVQMNKRPRRRKRMLNVIKRNLSYFRRKLKSINCCSNSIG